MKCQIMFSGVGGGGGGGGEVDGKKNITKFGLLRTLHRVQSIESKYGTTAVKPD